MNTSKQAECKIQYNSYYANIEDSILALSLKVFFHRIFWLAKTIFNTWTWKTSKNTGEKGNLNRRMCVSKKEEQLSH